MDKKYSDIAIEELEKNIERMQEQVRRLKADNIEGILDSIKTTHDPYTTTLDLTFSISQDGTTPFFDLLGKMCRITIEPLE